MKDQYFGDFGDYQKISLLKGLREANLNVLVHWMKTDDDNSNDGRHITYLDNPSMWMNYEPDIFEYIKQKIAKDKRSLVHIERSVFCERISFVNQKIENTKARNSILESIVSSDSHLVFFDPDNGIEVKSTNFKNVHKYVVWEEIIKTYNAGKSVLVYQHFSRINRESFIQNKLSEIKSKIGEDAVALKVKHSVYFIIPQPTHKNKLNAVLNRFTKKWQPFADLYTHEKGRCDIIKKS